MRSYWNAFRQFNKSILLYLFYWSMISFAYFGVVGVLMNLYLLRLGYETEFIGVVLGSGQLVWAIFALPAGVVGSRIGTKRAMVAGMLVSSGGMFLMLAAEALPTGLRQLGLVLPWMFSWVGSSLAAVNSSPFLMSVTNEQTRGFAFSAQQTVMAVAGFAGSVAAGILPGLFASQMNWTLDDPAPYRMALLLAPLAYLIAAWTFSRGKSVRTADQSQATPEALKAPIPLFLLLGLMIGLQSFSEGTVRAFFNVYLDTDLALPTELIGGIMGSSQLLMILVSLSIPAILARWGSRGTLTITTFGLAIFVLMLAWVPTRFGASSAYLGINGVMAILNTARGIYTQEAVIPRWRTTTSAISIIGLALGWALAAWLGGSFVKIAGFQGLFLLGSLIALLSAGLLFAHDRRIRVREAKESHIAVEPAIITAGEMEEDG